MTVQHVQFDLRCLCCGNKERREIPSGETEGPACARCYGPMIVDSVERRLVKKVKR